MVHYYATINHLKQKEEEKVECRKGMDFSLRELDDVLIEIKKIEETRDMQRKQLEKTNSELERLFSKKKDCEEKIDVLKTKLRELQMTVENVKLIDVIVVKGEKHTLKNGLVDLNRDTLMKLIKVICDEEKIKNVIGMMQLFYLWSKQKVFYWARKDSLIFSDSNLKVIKKLYFSASTRFALVYKASRDGFASKVFHEKCDGRDKTVTIFTSTEGYVFGGYAAVPWASDPGYSVDYSRQSFLFSLKNPRNQIPVKFMLLKKEDVYTTSCNPYFGPIFGVDDIICSGNYYPGSHSSTCLGHSFENTTGVDGTEVFTGRYYFTTSEITVYQVV